MVVFEAFQDLFEINSLTLWGLLLTACFAGAVRWMKVGENSIRWLIMFTAVGVLLRICWILFSSHIPQRTWNGTHMLESDVANVHALDLLKGVWFIGSDGLPSGRRPIGYPLALGLVYKVFGSSLEILWVFHLTLYILSSLALYGIGKELLQKELVCWPALILAVYPVSIYSIVLPTDEHLFVPIFTGGLWLLLRNMRLRSFKPSSLAVMGLVFGYTTMIRTHSIFMPLVVALAVWLTRFDWKRAILAAACVFVVMQSLNAPWVYRNYKAWGVPVIYTATSHFVYAQVNSTAKPQGGGHIPQKGEEGYSPAIEEAMRTGNEGQVHQLCQKAMTDWIGSNPLRFLAFGTARLLIFIGWDRSGGVWPIWFQYYEGSYDPARPISESWKHFFEEAAFASYYALFLCMLPSLLVFNKLKKWLAPGSGAAWWVMGSVFFFWFAEHMIIYPDRKYRFPLEVLMMVVCMPWLGFLGKGIIRERSRS